MWPAPLWLFLSHSFLVSFYIYLRERDRGREGEKKEGMGRMGGYNCMSVTSAQDGLSIHHVGSQGLELDGKCSYSLSYPSPPRTLPFLHCILSYIPFFIAWLTCLFLPSWHWTPNSLASTLWILRTQACATVPGRSVLFQSVRYFKLVSIFASCCMCGSNLSPSY